MASAEETCRAAFGTLPEWLERDGNLQRRGRGLDAALMVEAGAMRWRYAFRRGRIEEAVEGEPLMTSWDAAMRAPVFAWAEHWRETPRPGFHDLFAMRKRGLLRIEGDWRPVLRHLQFLKDVLALPRGRA